MIQLLSITVTVEIPDGLKYNIRTDDVWFDESNGRSEIETHNKKKAKVLVELPETIEEMKERMNEMVGVIYELKTEVEKYREFARASTHFSVALAQLLDELVKAGQLDAETVRRYAGRATDEQPDDGHPEGYA